MSFTDQGDQNLSIVFGDEFTAKNVGERFTDVVPFGVYKGFDLTIISSSEVEVSPGVVHIGDGKGNTIRAETTSSITLSPTPSTEFITVKWSYRASEGWFADIQAVGSPSNQMVVLAKIIFDNSDNVNKIDKRARDIPKLSDTGFEIQDELIVRGAVVEPTIEETSDSLSVGKQGRNFGIRTDQVSNKVDVNLPEGIDLEPGRVVEIFDSGGNASTNNIEVYAGSNESIEGQSSIVLSSDYASEKLRYFGGNSVWGRV